MNMHLHPSWPDPYKDWRGLCIIKVELSSSRAPSVTISDMSIGMRTYGKVTTASMLRLRAVLAAFDPPGIVLDNGSTIHREWHLPDKWSPSGEPGVLQMRPPIRISPNIMWPGGYGYAEMADQQFSSQLRLLEMEFHFDMFQLYERAKEVKYYATRFKQMLDEHRGVGAAKRLLASPGAQEGLTRLWELGQLDSSVEATVLRPKFRPLFTRDELAEARKRLEDLDYEG